MKLFTASFLLPFCASSALNAIDIQGYKFFDTVTNTSVVWKGIDYYPRPNAGKLNQNNLDFFTEEYSHIWERDIIELSALGVNAIRVYAVDPSQNHDAFMCALDAAGIYVIVGMAAQCEGCAITNDEAPKCYSKELKRRGQLIIKAFARYSNTLAFSAGNEVNYYAPSGKPEVNAPCQKKFLRDMRAYIASCPTMRQVPVGVVIADAERSVNALYYNCAGDDDIYENAEWYGINVYLTCDAGVTDSAGTGFEKLKTDFEGYGYSIPVMLTEFGCLSKSFPTIDGYDAQRTFEQAKWLYESDFQNVFAGGFVFEYSTELVNSKSTSPFPFTAYGPQNFGVGYLSPENCDELDTKCIFNRMPNFDALQSSYAIEASGSISKSGFEPPASRTGRTTCPSQFPKISDFSWESDDEDDLSCPNRISWSCTGDNPEVEQEDEVINGSGKKSNNTSSGTIAVSGLLSTFLCVAVVLF